MLVTSLVVAALAGIGSAAPWHKPKFPEFTASHHGYPGWPGKHSVYTPPAPKPTWYRPSHHSHSRPASTVSGHNSTVTSTTSISTASTSKSVGVTSNGACASVAVLAASQTSVLPSATPTVPADLAYECLNSIPFNQSAAVALLDSIDPYLNWQTTPEYLKDPPAAYVEHVQPPYDFFGTWDAIKANTSAGAYTSEYEFGWAVYRAFQLTHDGHFVFYPDSVTAIFSFARTTPLVSVSLDGKSAPEVYLYSDVLTASYGNATFTPSPIVEIDGQNATEYLLVWSEYGSLQDPDALWNNVFYEPAQVALGSSGSGTGTFSGGGRGRWVYPGASTSLVFANGTTVTNENHANVMVPFTGIASGEDIYTTYFAVPPEAYDNAFQIAASASASTSSAASSAASSTVPATTTAAVKSTPAPGYPSPIVRNPDNQNSGYFLDGEGYDDVAVLAVNSFVGAGSEVDFQNVNSELIAAAVAANKTKLIIDVSANGGGTILQGYDLFKQLFPSILPYGATRYRAHEAFNLLGIQDSYIAGLFPRSLSENVTIQDIEASSLDYRTDADVNYEPFTSWPEKYGPHEFGPANDTFTSIIRWNLSDVLTPDNSGGIYVSGYLNRSNVTVQPFARENIIIIYDGYCASTCTIFSELMRQQGGVKTIALGGRPNLDIIQAVGGVKGTNDYPYESILDSILETYEISNTSLQAEWEDSVLSNYTQLPLYRSTDSVVNARDGIRQGDTAELPLQFLYEPADCRILYTPAMVIDETAVWKTVADTVWNGGDACVAGSNDFYGNATGYGKRSVASKMHGIRRDLDVQEHFEAFSVRTGELTIRGDAVMKL